VFVLEVFVLEETIIRDRVDICVWHAAAEKELFTANGAAFKRTANMVILARSRVAIAAVVVSTHVGDQVIRVTDFDAAVMLIVLVQCAIFRTHSREPSSVCRRYK